MNLKRYLASVSVTLCLAPFNAQAQDVDYIMDCTVRASLIAASNSMRKPSGDRTADLISSGEALEAQELVVGALSYLVMNGILDADEVHKRLQNKLEEFVLERVPTDRKISIRQAIESENILNDVLREEFQSCRRELVKIGIE